MDTGQLSLTRTAVCLRPSTTLLEDTISCNFPLVWSVPKTSSRRKWIRSSKSAKDVSKSQMTSPYMAAPRQNMMPSYETLCILPVNVTWCSIHMKHMWRPKPSISLAVFTMPMVSTWTQVGSCCTCLASTHQCHWTSRGPRSSHIPKPLHSWSVNLDLPSMRAAQEGHRLHMELHLWHCFWVDQGSSH